MQNNKSPSSSSSSKEYNPQQAIYARRTAFITGTELPNARVGTQGRSTITSMTLIGHPIDTHAPYKTNTKVQCCCCTTF